MRGEETLGEIETNEEREKRESERGRQEARKKNPIWIEKKNEESVRVDHDKASIHKCRTSKLKKNS